MKNLSRIARALVPAALALGLCSASALALTPSTGTPAQTYSTTFVQELGPPYPLSAYPITGGRLQLKVSSGGFVTGYYTPADSAAFVPVTGGQNGSNLWFDIGNGIHVSAQMRSGEIVGSATQGGDEYRFTATPAAQG